jgi:phage host-nuclease inhibitor protein Gam
MPPTRRKAVRQLAPQTIEDATNLAAVYADILLGVEELRADADASIAAIQAERDRMIAPMEQRAKDIFLQLRAWWGVAGIELTDGKRKSYELAGCILGERTTPPSLKMPAKADEAAAMLLGAGLAEFCRHKVEVDKPVVLRALGSKDGLVDAAKQVGASDSAGLAQLLVDCPEDIRDVVAELLRRLNVVEQVESLGFRTVQKEEFFIDRAGPKAAPIETVEVDEAA